MYVWAVFTDMAMFEENAASSYANPFAVSDGAVLAHVLESEWSGEVLSDAEAIAAIDAQPIILPPPSPGPE